jgi:fused signal recognition particle receptor
MDVRQEWVVSLLFLALLIALCLIGVLVWARKRRRSPLLTPKPNLWKRLRPLWTGKGQLPLDWKEKLEEVLLSADVGYRATHEILASLGRQLAQSAGFEEVQAMLMQKIIAILKAPPANTEGLWDERQICLIIGVNGSGKTTTLVKLARHIQGKGKKVLLAACDTFRAGAVSQLEILAGRAAVPVVKGEPKQSPSAVLYDAIRAFEAQEMDMLLVDTAGRLHTKAPLIEELKKMRRVAESSGFPVRVLLVLDATQGQNALEQARQFVQAVGAQGVILTKMDGTAKGGIVLAIAMELGLPVYFLGVGEDLDDLLLFDPYSYTEALLSRSF